MISLQHHAVVAADFNDKPIPSARAGLNDLPRHLLAIAGAVARQG
jgi:hypothetical protein